MRLYIASSRPIGKRCLDWTKSNLPPGNVLVDSPEDCEIFISVLYDQILPKDFIDRRHRCFNFHPGILPGYRGAGAYSWAILNGESETGVTLHEIDYHIDSGPIICIEKTLIAPHDTAESLYSRCMDILFSMFCTYLPRLLRGDYSTQPNQGGRLYLRQDLDKAKDLTRYLRAFKFTGKESCYYYDQEGHRHNLSW